MYIQNWSFSARAIRMMLQLQGATSYTSLFCYSTFPSSHNSLLPFRSSLNPSTLPSRILPFKTLHCTATQEIVIETANSESEFVEVGYLYSVHGLQGEISVKPTTDFPELRFSQPGRRWLRQQVSGKDMIQEVELIEGRGHHGQKNWILSFGGIDTVEQARQLVGSTLLVREDDRPELEEGDFYTHDLVGMRVILKENGKCVGTVVNVFDSGANDLLQVMLYPSVDVPEGTETGASGPLVWVPFVEAIVPDVDMTKREMWITPPKGLLELNIRSDERSKKERRQLEWRERKRFQRRLIAAKKKLCEMEQNHVFDGLKYGENPQRSLLADQIVGLNSKLLQQALQNIGMSPNRWSITELINAARTKLIQRSLKVSKKCLNLCATEENLTANMQEKGFNLFSKGKVGVVLVVNDVEKNGRSNSPDVVDTKSTEDLAFSLLQESLSDDQAFLKMEDRAFVPLVLVCPMQAIRSLKKLFSYNDYFGFDANKVWFLEEEKLPIVESSDEKQSGYKILMKSPWEILQEPVGSGGVIGLLSMHGIPENLSEMGVEYIEVCSVSQNYVLGTAALLLGYVNSCKAEIGVQVLDEEEVGKEGSEESFDMILSMSLMKVLTKQMDKLPFHRISKTNSHVKLVDKEWTDIIPSAPNSYQFYSSIYSALNGCLLDKICVLEITE